MFFNGLRTAAERTVLSEFHCVKCFGPKNKIGHQHKLLHSYMQHFKKQWIIGGTFTPGFQQAIKIPRVYLKPWLQWFGELIHPCPNLNNTTKAKAKAETKEKSAIRATKLCPEQRRKNTSQRGVLRIGQKIWNGTLDGTTWRLFGLDLLDVGV